MNFRPLPRAAVALVATVAAVVAVLAGGGCTGTRPGAGAAPTSTMTGGPPDFRPGAAGIGDAYFPGYGNGGYDVRHYDLAVKYDPATDRLSGTATIDATATMDLSRFNLDLAGLTVREVLVNGADARYRRDLAELMITPPAGLRSGTAFTVEVTYDGKPVPRSAPGLGANGFLHTADGAFVIGEPEAATTWYPVNDHPLDKATYTIALTVPERLTAISNGVPAGTTRSAGWATWTWQVREPMASYLSTLAIGDYRVVRGTHRGKPMVTAVAARLPRGGADRAMARTGEIADFLAARFGPYPFEAYGGIVVDDARISYALETQTRPIYAASFFRSGDETWVVAHELAHQWYGDSVSVRHWKDIWLNEGFATYAQWLWVEHDTGQTVRQQFDQEYDSLPTWEVKPGDPGAGELFSAAVYRRGAMTLHALRAAVGDTDFFRVLRTWAAQRRNANAGTDDFIAVAERVSGEPLRQLFDAWLYGTTQPSKP